MRRSNVWQGKRSTSCASVRGVTRAWHASSTRFGTGSDPAMTTRSSLAELHPALVPLDDLQPAAANRVRLSANQDARPVHVGGIACIVLHATADDGDESTA